MKIKYGLINKILIIILGAIFVCEGLNFMFDFGVNHHLFHAFWVTAGFTAGLFVGEKLIDKEDDVFYEN